MLRTFQSAYGNRCIPEHTLFPRETFGTPKANAFLPYAQVIRNESAEDRQHKFYNNLSINSERTVNTDSQYKYIDSRCANTDSFDAQIRIRDERI